MNAGAYGGEMKDIIRSVTVMTDDGGIRTIAGDGHEVRLPDERCQKKGWIVLAADAPLRREIRTHHRREDERAKGSANLEAAAEAYPSAGSTFKRPEGISRES
jgi:UDP-N-acetylmuramate dehydrogenase